MTSLENNSTASIDLPAKVCSVRLQNLSATIPTRATERSAGFDLYSPISGTVPKRERKLIPLELQLLFPPETFGLIRGRSGLALKHGIDVLAGVIDNDFEGIIICNS